MQSPALVPQNISPARGRPIPMPPLMLEPPMRQPHVELGGITVPLHMLTSSQTEGPNNTVHAWRDKQYTKGEIRARRHDLEVKAAEGKKNRFGLLAKADRTYMRQVAADYKKGKIGLGQYVRSKFFNTGLQHLHYASFDDGAKRQRLR